MMAGGFGGPRAGGGADANASAGLGSTGADASMTAAAPPMAGSGHCMDAVLGAGGGV